MIRVVKIFDPAFNDLPPDVREYDEAQVATIAEVLAFTLRAPDVASFSVQRVDQWWPATWQQVLSGCEVLGEDGKTWVVSRALSAVSPHEVEIYEFGRPENRFTFTPRYDQPVQARFTHEAQMMALLMTELGARVIDDGKQG